MIDLAQFFEGFQLGSASILTTACLLPLYPGLIAFLAGNAENQRSKAVTGTLGVLVLAGVLTMMLFIGFLLSLFSAGVDDALPVLLPLVYGVVIVFGVLMYMGRNPFAKMQTVQAPILKNPFVTAYVYGLFFGPMALPCIGAFLVSAFGLGAVSSTLFINQMVYFLGFGLGFGWPLVVLPLLSLPFQRTITGWLTRHHTIMERISGVLLIAIGIFGIYTELVPQYLPDIELSNEVNYLYWLVVALIIAGIVYVTYRASLMPHEDAIQEKQKRAG